MVETNILSESNVRKLVDEKAQFSVFEYSRDISVHPAEAIQAYFASKMNIRKRQVVCNIKGGTSVITQAGAMQIMMGDINASTDVNGVGNLIGKAISSKVTGETAIKPKYKGNGILVLEPTYKHIILEDVSEWNGGMVIDDGLFLACDGNVQLKVQARKTLSSAVLGNEGLFNTKLVGDGVAVLESPKPREELVCVTLNNDVLKIDGNMAIAWSGDLDFTVERTTKSLIGSAASGEGLVNVYRGTGKVLIANV